MYLCLYKWGLSYSIAISKLLTFIAEAEYGEYEIGDVEELVEINKYLKRQGCSNVSVHIIFHLDSVGLVRNKQEALQKIKK